MTKDKKKLEAKKMKHENQVIGNTIMKMRSAVPDQNKLRKYE